jgi:GH25 family lysozyme M1 (1,4-beta-N-acetylmuramidase)
MIKFYVPGFGAPKKPDDRHGDAQVLSDGTYTLVIDGGDATMSDKLITWLRAQGMKEVCLVVSHWHYDHYHGIERIIKDKAFTVSKLYCPKPSNLVPGLSSKWAGDIQSEINAAGRIISEAEDRGAEVVYLTRGDEVTLGDIRFKVYLAQPNKCMNDDAHAWAFVNYGSLCLYFPDLCYLTTGDGPEAIKDAVAYFGGPVKWFKIPHHGNACTQSNTAACKAAGAVLAWYNGLEPQGPGTTAFTQYGARRCKQAGLMVWDTIGEISGRADAGRLTLEHNGTSYVEEVPYKKGGAKVPTLNGIDIASYQSGINLEVVPGDFVIIKATQGVGYVNHACNAQYASAKKGGKLLGLYHYAGGNDPTAEAEYFVKHIKGYIKEALLVLDWESIQNKAFNKNMVSWCKTWLDKVYELTGVRPLIYMSQSVTNTYDWSSVAKDYGLWVARYPDMNKTGYKETYAYGKVGAWKYPAIYQYTSSGQLNGWDGRLDLNIAYMTREAWGKYADPEGDMQEAETEPSGEPAPAPVETRTVTVTLPVCKIGSESMAVRLIEAALGAETEGVETTTTGVFDDELDAKVKAFQTAHSLTVDGVVGGATWPVLLGSWK